MLAPEAYEGFRAVGLEDCAELVEAAIAKLGNRYYYPRDQMERRDVLALLKLPGSKRKDSDPFQDLDHRYYTAKKLNDFYRRLDEFADRNAR